MVIILIWDRQAGIHTLSSYGLIAGFSELLMICAENLIFISVLQWTRQSMLQENTVEADTRGFVVEPVVASVFTREAIVQHLCLIYSYQV